MAEETADLRYQINKVTPVNLIQTTKFIFSIQPLEVEIKTNVEVIMISKMNIRICTLRYKDIALSGPMGLVGNIH